MLLNKLHKYEFGTWKCVRDSCVLGYGPSKYSRIFGLQRGEEFQGCLWDSRILKNVCASRNYLKEFIILLSRSQSFCRVSNNSVLLRMTHEIYSLCGKFHNIIMCILIYADILCRTLPIVSLVFDVLDLEVFLYCHLKLIRCYFVTDLLFFILTGLLTELRTFWILCYCRAQCTIGDRCY